MLQVRRCFIGHPQWSSDGFRVPKVDRQFCGPENLLAKSSQGRLSKFVFARFRCKGHSGIKQLLSSDIPSFRTVSASSDRRFRLGHGCYDPVRLCFGVLIRPENRTILVEAGRKIRDYPALDPYQWCVIADDTPGPTIFFLNPHTSYFKGGRRLKVALKEDFPNQGEGGLLYALGKLWKMITSSFTRAKPE